jgi:hypothetical protein
MALDLNKVGLMIGVLALLLAVPLAVIANLLTPRVRDWYSTSSRSRIRKRLTEIESRLHVAESSWTFTPGEFASYRAHYDTIRIISSGVHGGCSAILFGTAAYARFFQKDQVFGIELVAFSTFVSNLIYYIGFLRTYRCNREQHTRIGREELKQELERLQSLAAKA